jgi:hypothetical protein
MTEVTVAPKHTGALKLLPPKPIPTPKFHPSRHSMQGVAPGMEVESRKVEVGSRKLHIAPVHGAGIAALLLFRASLHTSFFMLLTSLPVASLV